MTGSNAVMRVRRHYNQWVADETLEDFALRFTAKRARRWSSWRVANTALGSISFLALEAIGGVITLRYGFDNAVAAIMVGGLILFLSGIPISYYAARYGVDIDLLTRGAGFGYIGSTVTSLIYASFTFIFFALEAAILALALELCFGLPLEIGYLLNALVVIPLVTHGITKISRFQMWTQPIWVLLHIVPFVFLYFAGVGLDAWTSHTGVLGPLDGSLDVLLLGAAVGVVLSLTAQIGEQVDFLRFLPEPVTRRQKYGWWAALLCSGPGWAVLGVLKMLAGSFLAILAFGDGVPPESAVEPTQMYLSAFQRVLPWPEAAIIITALFVIISQLKINVTNAYAGSIAWSNFFSRLTHSHPGRVVWLVFNVAIALMLTQFGVFGAIEHTLGLYSHVAVAWVGAIVADLTVNKPLGLSPREIEFRRAHLYDINPVGVGAMIVATVLALLAYFGALGETAQSLSAAIALSAAFITAPIIAFGTRGRYYIARPVPVRKSDASVETCCICEYTFEQEDMTHCPFYAGPICSLCCSLDARCHDACKPGAGLGDQIAQLTEAVLPPRLAEAAKSKYGLYAALMTGFMTLIGLVLGFIYHAVTLSAADIAAPMAQALWLTFGALVFIVGVAVWLYVLANESRAVAQKETEFQTELLKREINAHEQTDAALQEAKDAAEAANNAKSRYVVGISHELRTPLNAILGYAQLLEADPTIPDHRRQCVSIIRRSGEHLSGLIEGLLDISRIEAGKLEILDDTVHFPDFLEQLVAVFRMQAESNGLAFDYHAETRIPRYVRTDEKRLRQILMNLLSNAVRYTDAGSVCFSVRYRNQVATFRVTDTGRGIAPEDFERIYEPFQRLRSSGAPAVPGTGLGLTITKLLTDLLGGDIQVESIPGAGSTFRVMVMLPSLTPQTIATPENVRRIHGYKNGRRRIMVVDDDADHRQLIENALEPLGFDLSFAESGEVAEVISKEATPDLFLLDVALPGIDGWELARRLRANGFARTPIIMHSAHAEEWARHGESGDLHDDFVPKPVNLDDLLSRIEKHLDLEWIFESAPAAAKGGNDSDVVPLIDDIRELRQLVEVGHAHGIHTKLDQLAAGSSELLPFVQRMRNLMSTYDLARMNRVLKEMDDDRAA